MMAPRYLQGRSPLVMDPPILRLRRIVEGFDDATQHDFDNLPGMDGFREGMDYVYGGGSSSTAQVTSS